MKRRGFLGLLAMVPLWPSPKREDKEPAYYEWHIVSVCDGRITLQRHLESGSIEQQCIDYDTREIEVSFWEGKGTYPLDIDHWTFSPVCCDDYRSCGHELTVTIESWDIDRVTACFYAISKSSPFFGWAVYGSAIVTPDSIVGILQGVANNTRRIQGRRRHGRMRQNVNQNVITLKRWEPKR